MIIYKQRKMIAVLKQHILSIVYSLIQEEIGFFSLLIF